MSSNQILRFLQYTLNYINTRKNWPFKKSGMPLLGLKSPILPRAKLKGAKSMKYPGR